MKAYIVYVKGEKASYGAFILYDWQEMMADGVFLACRRIRYTSKVKKRHTAHLLQSDN